MQSTRRQIKRGNSIIITDSIKSDILHKKQDRKFFRLNHPKRDLIQEKSLMELITFPISKAEIKFAKENNMRFIYSNTKPANYV